MSPDRHALFVCETRAGSMLGFTVAEDGHLSQRRGFVTLSHIPCSSRGAYSPDGLHVDSTLPL